MVRPALLDRAAIEALIPHAGAMVLLDAVESWDEERIICTTESHRRPGNPLARDGRVPAICGVEYGGQAMALHGALTSGKGSPRGLVVNVRNVFLAARTLDSDYAIIVEAEHLAGSGEGVIYRFALSTAGRTLMSGQATVRLLGGDEELRRR
jgi:predicted hotdog family 3-hydroxylacyl-ACP dehydratase